MKKKKKKKNTMNETMNESIGMNARADTRRF